MRRKLALVCALAATAAALVGGTTVLASGPGPAYLHVTSFSRTSHNANLVKLSVTTGAAIPRRPDAFIGAHPVVGIAWADLDSRKVFVVTIHPVLGRDSRQRPDSWHAHTATLAPGATSPNDLCLASIDSTPTAGIATHRARMDVNVRRRALPVAPSSFDAAVGFTIERDAACASGLAVRLVS